MKKLVPYVAYTVLLAALLVAALSPGLHAQSTRRCQAAITQQSISASALVPTTAVSGQTEVAVFNQDTGVNLFCGTSATATTANSAMIEPRTGRSFEIFNRLTCVAASGTVVVDVTTKVCQ